MKALLKARRVKEILIKRNLSQNNFAYRVGTNSGYMSQLMSGLRCPSPELRQKIMEFLKVSNFDELFRIKN